MTGDGLDRIRNERGIALVVAIFALVVIGALVAGSFFVGTQEQRIGLNTLTAQQAMTAAEQGATIQVAGWDAATANDLAVGDSATFSGTLASDVGWYRGSVVRLNSMLFLVRSEGFSADSASRQHVGMLVRLRPIEIDIQAALSTQGATRIGGSSYIDGNDQAPSAWTGCPALLPPLPGARIPDPSDITTSGCKNLSCVDGDPKIEGDTTITTTSLTTFGDVQFDELRSMATKILPGGTWKIEPTSSGGTCNTAPLDNWGSPLDPTGPCGNYFPIVWSDGDLNINGVQGQGILIVNGDLNVQGNFEFMGPVIVRNILSTQGTGGHFNGGVIAANVNLEQNTVLGNAVVNFSSCAVARALNGSAPGTPLVERSWANLY